MPLGNRHVVVRTIDRTDLSVVDALAPIGTATVHEAIGRRGYLGPEIRPIQRDVRVAGNAVTVLSHPGDNMMIHAAVEVCQEGDVLVVATTAPSTHGMFGDLLASSLSQRGAPRHAQGKQQHGGQGGASKKPKLVLCEKPHRRWGEGGLHRNPFPKSKNGLQQATRGWAPWRLGACWGFVHKRQ